MIHTLSGYRQKRTIRVLIFYVTNILNSCRLYMFHTNIACMCSSYFVNVLRVFVMLPMSK